MYTHISILQVQCTSYRSQILIQWYLVLCDIPSYSLPFRILECVRCLAEEITKLNATCALSLSLKIDWYCQRNYS